MSRTASKKDKTAVRTDSPCWLCGDIGDVWAINIISEDDQDLLKTYYEIKLLKTPDIEEYRLNLCQCCYRRFSGSSPGWVFIPTDLNDLLETERDFQAKREHYAQNGKKLKRTLPSIFLGAREKREFTIYQTRASGIHKVEEVLRESPRRVSTINPVVAIIHSAKALHKNVRLSGEKFCLPDHIAGRIYNLLHLYMKSAPEIAVVPREAEENQTTGDHEDSAIDMQVTDETEVTDRTEDSGEQDAEQEPGVAGPSSKRKRDGGTRSTIRSGSANDGGPVHTMEAVPSSATESSGNASRKRPKSNSHQKTPAVDTGDGGQSSTSSSQTPGAIRGPKGKKTVDIREFWKKG